MVGTMEMREGCGVVVEESGKWFGVQIVEWEGIAYKHEFPFQNEDNSLTNNINTQPNL
jgi:hypothetical protein